jgi:hypothetical protein
MGRDIPTTDRLRHDIDHGRAADKQGFHDPAAAPLGTDDEASGNPPTPEQRAKAYEAEIASRPNDRDARGAGRPVSGESEHARSGAVRWLVAAVVVILLGGLVFFA